MHNGQGGWLPARAALHATGLYFALREIDAGELHDPFMQETLVRSAAAEEFVQIARQDLGRAAAASAPTAKGGSLDDVATARCCRSRFLGAVAAISG